MSSKADFEMVCDQIITEQMDSMFSEVRQKCASLLAQTIEKKRASLGSQQSAETSELQQGTVQTIDGSVDQVIELCEKLSELLAILENGVDSRMKVNNRLNDLVSRFANANEKHNEIYNKSAKFTLDAILDKIVKNLDGFARANKEIDSIKQLKIEAERRMNTSKVNVEQTAKSIEAMDQEFGRLCAHYDQL